jgi:zinc/manganese transport system ATP-binding protein
MTPALEIKNLSIKYPGYSYLAVEDATFSIKKGQITALIGPNGSGKTTLLKEILGFVNYKGEIKVFDEPVKKMYGKIGYVPQRYSFDSTFPITVEEFLSLVLTKKTTKQARLQVSNVLELVEGKDLTKKRFSTLSGGQLQRVLLARALIKKPRLLLLDEPEAGVDVGGEQVFYDLLEKLVEKKKLTALVTSHELDVVYTYAEHVVCMNKKVFCTGAPKDVLDQNTFKELYGRDLRFYGHVHNPSDHNH